METFKGQFLLRYGQDTFQLLIPYGIKSQVDGWLQQNNFYVTLVKHIAFHKKYKDGDISVSKFTSNKQGFFKKMWN